MDGWGVRILERGWAGPLGAGIGVVGAVFDLGLFSILGVRAQVAGRPAELLVFGLFASTFSALGFVIGRLLEARHALGRSAGVIRAQLRVVERSREAALASERLATVGQLAAGVAHEVRNPLGVIRASTQVLMEDLPAGSDAARAAGFVRDEVDRLNGFVTALLDVARPVSGVMGPVVLAEVVGRVHVLARDTLRASGAEWRVEGEGGLVWGDGGLLTQLLLGLVTNAAQLLGGPGEVLLRLGRVGSGAFVEVADSGPGVDALHRPHLFEPFFTTRPGGTGLGLVMAQRIVLAHGGRLTYEEGRGAGPAGVGACFRVELPGTSPADAVAIHRGLE